MSDANPDDPDFKVCPRCNCWIARPLEWEPIEARVEIARLQADLDTMELGFAAVRHDNAKLRAALEEVYLSVKPLLPAGWSDAQHVMNVISEALAKEGK